MLHAITSLLKALPRGTAHLNLRRTLIRRGLRGITRDFDQPHPRYFSQHGQDLFVDNFIFRGRRDGFFVDVGAYDGVTYSNTCFLERELGWRGICFEANPRAHAKLAAPRKCTAVNAGVGAEERSLDFLSLPSDGEMGSGFLDFFPPEQQRDEWVAEMCRRGGVLSEVKIVDFNHALQAHACERIDYLSIDTEGADFEVLKALDLARFRVEVVDIENNFFGDEICVYMDAQGYELRAVLGTDEIYQRR